MRRKFLCLAVLIVGSAPASSISLQAQTVTQPKDVAVTIDDLPLNGPQFEAGRLRAMTDKILAAINKHQIPVVGFVNESLLQVPGETDARVAILKAWADGGVELGNHTFSHLGFKDASLNEYQDDFLRGEVVTRRLLKQKGQKVRYFRHPFLQLGPTRELEQSFESFIAERGYKIAPVTVDVMDWMILSAYADARAQGDGEMAKRVSDEYLKFAERKFDFCEQVATELFGHPIKHVLLLHLGAFSSTILPDLFDLLKKEDFTFVTLEEAQSDPAYDTDPDAGSKYGGTLLEQWMDVRQLKYPDLPKKPYKRLDAICR